MPDSSAASIDREWDRLRAFACYKGRCECGWRGPSQYYPWDAEDDEAAHRNVCAVLNLDLRRPTRV